MDRGAAEHLENPEHLVMPGLEQGLNGTWYE